MLEEICVTCSIHVTEKKVSKEIHKGKCALYSIHVRKKICERKYATYTVFARARARACVCVCVCVSRRKQECKRQNIRKRDIEKKRENSRDQRFKDIPTTRVFPFTRVVAVGKEESGVRLIKIRIASYISRRMHIGVYLCFSWEMYHMEKFTIFLYILKISISGNITLTFLVFWIQPKIDFT